MFGKKFLLIKYIGNREKQKAQIVLIWKLSLNFSIYFGFLIFDKIDSKNI